MKVKSTVEAKFTTNFISPEYLSDLKKVIFIEHESNQSVNQ